jgi:hypothetical protein
LPVGPGANSAVLPRRIPDAGRRSRRRLRRNVHPYQIRVFLDQVTGASDPAPPNASFADALHTMEVIQAVVKSFEADGASVPVG